MEKRRIVIIDSQEQDVRKLQDILEDGDYQVAVAFNSKDGLELCQNFLPALVLLAIQSPGLNGLEILQSLKKRGTTRDLPVLILLEKFDEEYAAQGLHMGAADYVLKTASRDLLLRRVGVLARVRQQDRKRREIISRYREFFDGEQYGLFLSSPEGRFLDVNRKLIRMLGYDSREELLGIDVTKDLYWDSEDRERFQKAIETQGFIKDSKVNFKRKDGQKLTILLNGQVVRDESGAIIGYEGYNLDVTGQTSAAELSKDHSEEHGFLGRFLKRFIHKVLPLSGDFFSLVKMSELMAERYEKVELLARGSYGEVWKVRDTEREGHAPYYVAKIPRNKEYNDKFRHEAEICQQLEGHRNTIKIIDVVEHRGRVVLIQEFVAGSSLLELIYGSMGDSEKERIILQLVDVVAHAHKNRIVHRDIKPENVIIRSDGLVKLLDYGVAKELKDKKLSSTMVGSRPYMSPEQIMGRSQIASDVWALGVVIYMIYTKMLPFVEENEKALMDLILNREPDPPSQLEPDIPEELERIILKCLEKDPKERFADAEVLKETILDTFPRFGKNS